MGVGCDYDGLGFLGYLTVGMLLVGKWGFVRLGRGFEAVEMV